MTSTALTVATTWAAQTSGKKLFARSRLDLGTGRAAVAVAILGWDFLYYWNHRASHESRWLWAVHVAHHSSERYNLSTALRQPVAEGVTLTVPYGLLGLLGVRPALVEQARGVNLIYQFWIHTETIRRLGRLEKVLNTPSHHRVHHGSNRKYLDRNHGSILIIWDRLFGTFEEEDEDVVYGLTRNIGDLQPAADRLARVARHRPRRRRRRDLVGPLVLPAPRPGLGLRPSPLPRPRRLSSPRAVRRPHAARSAAPRRRRGRATGARARRGHARPRRSRGCRRRTPARPGRGPAHSRPR